jgi:O-antigen/teichoic acid export membrane protein
MISLLRSDYAKSFIGQVFMAGSNMVAFSVLARTLTKVELGIWILVLTITAFIENFRSGFFSSAYVRLANSSAYRKEDIGFTILMMNLAIHGMVALFAGVGNFFLADTSPLLFYVIALTFSSLTFDFIQWHTLALNDFTKNTRIVLSQSGISLLLIAMLAFLSKLTVASVVLAVSASKVIATLAHIGVLKSFVAVRAKVVPNVARLVISFGKHTATTLLGSQAMRFTDVTLLNWVAGPVMVALLSVPDKLVQVLSIPIRSINKAFYPRAAVFHTNNNHANWLQEFSTTLTIVLLLCTVVSTIVVIAAEPLVILIGGAEFTEAADVLRLYILVICVNSVATLLGVGLESVGCPQVNSTLLMVLVPINLVADYVALQLLPRPEAVILVTLLTACVGLVWLYLELRKRTNFSIGYYVSHGFRSSLGRISTRVGLR